MKNSLVDLNNHLFEAIERLNDEDIKAEQLEKEITRSNAICNVATQVIENSKVLLRAAELKAEYGGQDILPETLNTTKRKALNAK